MKFLKDKQIALLLLLLAGFVLAGQAQEQRIRFERLTVDDGLSNSEVHCAFQDSRGYMWFGTKNGLNRFDGYSFHKYFADQKDSASISSDFVRCMAQTPDGTVWVGTDDGGLNAYSYATDQFRSFTSEKGNPNSLPTNSIISLYTDQNGTLWVGTNGGGLAKLVDPEKGKFKVFGKAKDGNKGPNNSTIYDIEGDGQGNLFLGTFGGGLNIMDRDKETFRYLKNEPGNHQSLSSNDIYALNYIEDRKELWVGTSGGGLCRYSEETEAFERYTKSDTLENSISSNTVNALLLDERGNLWIGTEDGGLNKFNHKRGTFHSYKNDPADLKSLTNNTVTGLWLGKGGTIWATTQSGLNKFEQQVLQFKTYYSDEEAGNNFDAKIVKCLYEDHKNRVWIGTFGEGLYYLDRHSNTFQKFEGTEKTINSLSIDEQNRLWVGTENGLHRINLETLDLLTFKAGEIEKGGGGDNGSDPFGGGGGDPFGGGGGDPFGGGGGANQEEVPAAAQDETETKLRGCNLPSSQVQSVYTDSEGNVWVGTYDGTISKYDPEKQDFVCYNAKTHPESGLPQKAIKVIYEDHQGKLWLGTQDGGLVRFDPLSEEFNVYTHSPTDPKSISNNYIYSIYEDQANNLWVGTFGGGLCKFDRESGDFVTYNKKKGLPDDVIYGILGDEGGHLWLSTDKGICRFNTETEKVRTFTEKEGLPSNEFAEGAYHKNQRGELYFGSVHSFVLFDPATIQDQTYVPPIYLTRFSIYEKPVDFKNPIYSKKRIEINYEQNFFSFDFVMLNYSAPEKVQYFVKMVGFDKEWRSNNNLTYRSYTNLDAGKTYTFRVKAVNEYGIENEKGAAIELYIQPPWWETWWFRISFVVVLVTSVTLFVRQRIKNLERRKQELENLVAERTKDLAEEKKEVEKQKAKSDELLLNILPLETANELKEKGASSPRHYQKVSVLFTDFKGFTKVSERLTPDELINELNVCFMKFDEILEDHNLEKIKTIGDAYMCAGGMPKVNNTHHIDSVLTGLKIQKFMNDKKAEKEAGGESYWQLRLGIHTGPVVAGVIGKKKFAYDIWGDAVNTASRMESSGEVGKINISGDTYADVKDFFETEYRGKVHAKNKGDIDMYFVHRIRPELSADEKGILPNEVFMAMVKERFVKNDNEVQN